MLGTRAERHSKRRASPVDRKRVRGSIAKPSARDAKRRVSKGSNSSKGRALLPVCIEQYPYPPEIKAVMHVREPKSQWPARSLHFKYWGIYPGKIYSCERDECVRDVLRARGWKDCGDPCDPEDYNDLADALKGKIPKYKPPRRCLYVSGDDQETRLLLKCLGNDQANRYLITGFPGGEPSCYKSYTCKSMKGKPFVPPTFLVPQEREELLACAKSKPGSYWVGKPKNDYGGRGLCVAKGVESLAEGKGVVQEYVHRPLLVGGYKFHMRVYLFVTALRPVRAYVHNDLTVMFTTLPFSMDAATLGPGASFENRVHLSNYDINARPSNRALYFKDKPGVGKGCMWSAPRLEKWLLKTKRAELHPDRMWRQIRILCREVALSIADHRIVKSFEHAEGQCHELFGLDVMMDDDGKVWLLECNNSPGLEYCGSHFPDGTPNPDAEENDAVTWAVIDDRMALLGYDHSTSGNEMNYFRVC